MAIRVAQARQICTPAELDLVLQSTTRQIGSLDPKQLRSSIRRARTLRDKWRDRAASQTRTTKSQNADKVGEANARSSDKAQLFDEALNRFEKRLSKIDGASAGAASTAKPQPSKPARTDEHRATRASVRRSLSQQTDKLSTNGAAAASAPAAGSTANSSQGSATAANAATNAATNNAAGKRAVAKKGATPQASAKRKGAPKRKAPPRSSVRAESASSTAPVPVATGLAAAAMAAGREGTEGSSQTNGKARKRSPQGGAATKPTAVKPGGGSRMPGEVAAQGRRNQAKRGSR